MANLLWTEELKPGTYPRLPGDLEADIAIIGAGITGLMSAYLLAKAGKAPVVLDKESTISGGETGATTAFLTAMPDADLEELRRTFGDGGLGQVLESGRWSINFIEQVIREEDIDCDFSRCAARIYAAAPADAEKLKAWADLLARHGSPAVFRERGEDFERFGYLELPSQAKFHPGKFLKAIAEKIVADGGKIFLDTTVEKCGGKDKATLTTSDGTVTANEVIVATHSPVDTSLDVQIRVSAFQSYVIAGDIPKGAIPEGLYWDTASPYHYFRIDSKPDADRIILGGSDHRTGQGSPEAAMSALRNHLPMIIGSAPFTLTHSWNGQIFRSIDRLPFIGRPLFNKRHHVATGFDGYGMTMGPVAAKIITDGLLGKQNAWAKLYSPRRLKKPLRLMSLGLETTWRLIADRVRALAGGGASALKSGEGKVVTIKGKNVAVSRDQAGKTHAVSAVCTHAGCLVHWNGEAKTWDCPCHGSRFKPTGEVINGPAVKPLPKQT